MKKFMLIMLAMLGISMVSCNGVAEKTETTCDSDTVQVDTAAVDTVVVDSVK